MKLIFVFCILILTGCAAKTHKTKEPDVMVHEEKSSIFHHQVWRTSDGQYYIKDLKRGTIKYWD